MLKNTIIAICIIISSYSIYYSFSMSALINELIVESSENAAGNWILIENLHVSQLDDNKIVFYNLDNNNSKTQVDSHTIIFLPLSISEYRLKAEEKSLFGALHHLISVNNSVKLDYACYLAEASRIELSMAILNALKTFEEHDSEFTSVMNSCIKYNQGDKSDAEIINMHSIQYKFNLSYLLHK